MAPEPPSAELPLDALETVARAREREGFDVTAVNTRTLLALVASARRLATAEVARDSLRVVFRAHYLTTVICDPVAKQDNPVCSCSLVHLGWHPSIGEAVQAWVEHVLGILGTPA